MSRRYIDFVPSKKAQPVVKRGQEMVRVPHVEIPEPRVVRRVVRRTAVRSAKAPVTDGNAKFSLAPPVSSSGVARPVQAAQLEQETVAVMTGRAATVARNTVSEVTPAVQSVPVSSAMQDGLAFPVVQSGSVSTAMQGGLASPAMQSGPALGVVEDLSNKFVNTEVPKRPLNVPISEDAATAKAKKMKLKRNLNVTDQATAEPKKNGTKGRGANATYQTPKTPFINQGKIEKRPLSKNVYQKKALAITKQELSKQEPKGPVAIIAKPEKDSHVGVVVTIIITIILGATAGTVAFLLLPK